MSLIDCEIDAGDVREEKDGPPRTAWSAVGNEDQRETAREHSQKQKRQCTPASRATRHEK